jgi:hypothetical protein
MTNDATVAAIMALVDEFERTSMAQDRTAIESAIRAALVAERDAAFERAAVCCAQLPHISGVNEDGTTWQRAVTRSECAAAIRALKGEQR